MSQNGVAIFFTLFAREEKYAPYRQNILLLSRLVRTSLKTRPKSDFGPKNVLTELREPAHVISEFHKVVEKVKVSFFPANKETPLRQICTQFRRNQAIGSRVTVKRNFSQGKVESLILVTNFIYCRTWNPHFSKKIFTTLLDHIQISRLKTVFII